MNKRQLFAMRSLSFAPAPAAAMPAVVQFAASSPDDKETVTVQRRRRPTSSGQRERADTPTHDRQDQGGAPPPPRPPQGPGGGRPPSSGGGRPGGQLRLPGLVLLLVVFLCIGAFTLFNRGGDDTTAPAAPQPAATRAVATQAAAAESGQQPQPTAVPAVALQPAPGAGERAEWLIMLYQDADDKILEQDIFVDFNEAERAGSGGQVHVVSQIDRFQGGYRGDGDWTGTKRYYVTYDGDLDTTGAGEVADLGEVNMADGDTLVDFVTWAVETYPADKHVLILSDHGMGWPGGWTDPTAPRSSGGNSPMEQRMGDQLFLNELDAALEEIRAQTGIDKFELIGLDACLMAHLEVFSALEPHARYAVASQETEPAVGWAYTSFLSSLQQNPNISGAELGKLIVDSYIQDDQRIVDDDARAALVGRGRAPSASQLARQMESNVTLTAVDLSELPALTESVNDLAYALQEVNQKLVAQARSYAQSYTSIFGNSVPPSYLDLGNFVQLLAEGVRGGAAEQATAGVQDALDSAIIAERHGSGKPGSNGVSIYFPNSDLYRNPVSGYESYGAIAQRFAQASLWDDFLTYHYTGREFERGAQAVSVPQQAAAVRGPAAGGITVSPITPSADSVAPGDTVLLSVDIEGENVGYVKLFAGYYDAESNSIYVADEDYLESEETRENDGVYYPVWPENAFTMQFEWEPIVFAVDDGNLRAEAVFVPQTYGASFEEALYAVDGVYTYADENVTRPARMYFRNGVMEQVFGFTGEGAAGAPREILPRTGDSFTVMEKWMELSQDGRVESVVAEEGETIVFGDAPIEWRDLDAAAGDYVVGFLVEDLDGNQYPAYTQITVE